MPRTKTNIGETVMYRVPTRSGIQERPAIVLAAMDPVPPAEVGTADLVVYISPIDAPGLGLPAGTHSYFRGSVPYGTLDGHAWHWME